MSKKTQTNGASTPSTTPQAAPSIEALRALPDLDAETRDRIAERLSAVLDALAQPAPAFLDTLPQAGASARELAPADSALHSDLWPDAAGVTTLLSRLSTVLSSPSALDLFAGPEDLPAPYYSRPRLGFRAGDTAEDLKRYSVTTRRIGAAPAGCARYECELTGRTFDLPLGAPVPTLLFDTPGTKRAGPFDLSDRAPLHPSEYVEGEGDGPLGLTVHPALVEAGPAHVLGAAWQNVEHRLFEATEALIELVDRAAALSGVEPEALGVEWPARAYRRWDRVERTGEARTWRRELAGVSTT